MDALDEPFGPGPGPAVRGQGAQHLVPQPLGLVDGHQGVEDVVLAAAPPGHRHHQQEGLLGVEVGLAVQGRVLEGVFPALGEFLLAAPDPVGVGDPLAGVGMAQGVVEDADLAAEDWAGDELALLLALHHLPVPVDQGQVAGVGRRGLGQGYAAGGDGGQRRQEHRGGQQDQPASPAGLVI